MFLTLSGLLIILVKFKRNGMDLGIYCCKLTSDYGKEVKSCDDGVD